MASECYKRTLFHAHLLPTAPQPFRQLVIRVCVMMCSRAEWSQVGSEVSYNRCRYGVLHRGQLGLYQVGSPSLGQLVGADDIEKAAVGWDVFKIAKLVDLKVPHSLSQSTPLHTTVQTYDIKSWHSSAKALMTGVIQGEHVVAVLCTASLLVLSA